MSRNTYQMEIVRRIRIGRFEYIGVDNMTPPNFYAGYGIPPQWTRQEFIERHFSLTRDTQERLAIAFDNARRKWEAKHARMARGDWDAGNR